MSSECYRIAAEGWRILSQYKESREGARHLLKWLAKIMDITFIGIRYFDSVSDYGWEERVLRNKASLPAQFETSRLKSRPFPVGKSSWLLDASESAEEEYGSLLDLFAEQWLSGTVPAAISKGNRPREADSNNDVNNAWVAVSRSARIVLNRLSQLGQSVKPLLLIGETGSGRSHVAALIHKNGFDPSKPFLREPDPIDFSAGGTCFIPSWENASARYRSLYLNTPARIIASAKSGNGEDVLRKEWKDLTGGEGLILTVPSLRERKEDIPLLADEFLKTGAASCGRKSPVLSPAAMELLYHYSWPGNTRELKETMIRSLSYAEKELVPEDLPAAIRGSRNASTDRPFPEKLIAIEYRALKEELTRQRGNMTRTARALGLTPRQVSWRVRKYGIDPRDFKPQRRNTAKL